MKCFGRHLSAITAITAAFSWLGTPVRSQNGITPQEGASLVVGWNDEFNGMNWAPRPMPHKPDISTRRKGFLKLYLGLKAPVDPGLPFNWATVSRIVDVDVDRYPILAVRAVNLKNRGWWDVSLQGCSNDAGTALTGKEIKTPSLDHDGTILFDLAAQSKNGLDLKTHKFLVRLNVAGPTHGVSVEYDWIRFVRRQDAERLRVGLRISEIVVEP